MAQWDQREIHICGAQALIHHPKESLGYNSSLQTKCVVYTKILPIFVLTWFEPFLPAGFVTVGLMFQDCVTAGRVVTPPNTHTPHFWVCKSTAEFPLSSLPCSLGGRSRLQLPNLLLSLVWGLLDQFLILFFLVLKGMMFWFCLVFFLKGRDRAMTKVNHNLFSTGF